MRKRMAFNVAPRHHPAPPNPWMGGAILVGIIWAVVIAALVVGLEGVLWP